MFYSKVHHFEPYQSHARYYFDQITIAPLKFLVILILHPNVPYFGFIELLHFELRRMHFTPLISQATNTSLRHMEGMA